MNIASHLRFIAVALTVVAICACVYFWRELSVNHANLRADTVTQAANRASQLAEAEADHIESLLLAVDMTLRHFRDAYQAHDRPAVKKIVDGALGSFPSGSIVHFSVVSKDGFMEYRSSGLPHRAFVGDRQYVAHFAAHPRDGGAPYLNKPVISRVDGQWVALLTRPLLGSSGLAGTASVSMSPEYFARAIADVSIAREDVISIVFDDGAYLARSRNLGSALGRSLPADRPFLAPDAPEAGTFEAIGLTDNVPRLVAWHRVAGYPLFVLVGLDKETLLAPAERAIAAARQRTFTAMAVLLALVGVVVLLLVRGARQQRQLAESSSLLQAVVDTTPFRVFWKDRYSRFMGCNPSFARDAGKSDPGELIGKTDDDMVWAEQAEKYRADDARVMASGVPELGFEEVQTTPAGKTIWLRTSKMPLRGRDGEIIGVLGAYEDITEQKLAKQAAEDLARSKSEFLANMSHEIRTPLSAVLGLARIGMRENEGRRSASTFRGIIDAGEHLLAVINDILDYSKIESAKMRIESQPFRLRKLLANVSVFLLESARAKGLAYGVETAPDLPEWVSGDALRLQQVLINLLSNAFKFTERGEVRVTVAHEDGRVYFRITDTGIGMTDEQMDRVFQPFEQADGSMTRRFGGSGLGLAISRNLAELMGGRIDVESAPGAGSSFSLELPLPATAAPADAEQDATSEADTQGRLAGIRVLAAEDVEVNRVILANLLDEDGALCLFVEDGRAAVEQVQASPRSFDVVLMDVQMPEMDGYEATRRIRAIAPGLPVIGLTAHAMKEARDKCLDAGMVDHITKPVDNAQLVAAILRWSGRHAEGHEPRQDRSAAGSAPHGDVAWETLRQRFHGKDPAFTARLAKLVHETHGATPARLARCADERDMEELARIAHVLRGVLGNMAAVGLQATAAEIEEAARRGEASAAALAREFIPRFEEFLSELAGHVAASNQRGW